MSPMRLSQQGPRSVLSLFHTLGLCPRNCTGQTYWQWEPWGRERTGVMLLDCLHGRHVALRLSMLMASVALWPV